MENRSKKSFARILLIFASIALSLAQFGCSSKTDNTAPTAQPAASPKNAMALTSASPGADTSSSAASNPNASSANPTGVPNMAPANPAGAANKPGASGAASAGGSAGS